MSEEPPFALGPVAIVGAGQVGTAMGMALRSAGVTEVALLDRDPEVARKSLARGAGNRMLEDADEALAAEVVLLALPMPEIAGFLSRHGGRARPGSLVMDTGSTKLPAVEAMRSHLPETVGAVGGHPVAGTETPGPAGAAPELLRGAPFVLTPVRPDPAALSRAHAVVRAVRARPVEMDAALHDRLAVRTILLPHLLAYALALTVSELEPEARDLVGGGFGSVTRLAASDPAMVAGFLRSNPEELALASEDLVDVLRRILEHLEEEGAAEAAFEQARAVRKAMVG